VADTIVLAVVEFRHDESGERYLALQGQSKEEAKEMNRKYKEDRDRIAARIFNDAFWSNQ
jgi:hypothetical protein